MNQLEPESNNILNKFFSQTMQVNSLTMIPVPVFSPLPPPPPITMLIFKALQHED